MQKKILIIGDSYAEGIGVPWEKTVAGLLERDFAPKGVDVLNAAVASYCPSLMLAKLGNLYQQHKLRANVVVVFIDISDVEDELTYYRLPHGEFVSNPAPPWQDPAYSTLDLVFLEWIRVHVEKNFTLLGATLRNLRILWRQLGSPGGTPELTRGTWPDYRGPAEPLVQQGLEKAAGAMGEIARLVGTQGGRLIVVIYPWREQAESGVQPSRVEKFWNAWAQGHGVELLNLFPDFVSMGRRYERKYCIPGDGHWNDAGHARVEELLLPKIESALR